MEIKEESGKIYNHQFGFLNDYTLCGLAYEGFGLDFSSDNFSPMKIKKGKITCSDCILIILGCKKIDNRNLKTNDTVYITDNNEE